MQQIKSKLHIVYTVHAITRILLSVLFILTYKPQYIAFLTIYLFTSETTRWTWTCTTFISNKYTAKLTLNKLSSDISQDLIHTACVWLRQTQGAWSLLFGGEPGTVEDGITVVWGRSSAAGRERKAAGPLCYKTSRHNPSCVDVAGFVRWPW